MLWVAAHVAAFLVEKALSGISIATLPSGGSCRTFLLWEQYLGTLCGIGILLLLIFNSQGLVRGVPIASLLVLRPSGAVAESVERRPREREIGNSVEGQVKPMTYKRVTFCFLVWCLALIG